MDTFRLIISILFLLFAGFVVVANYQMVYLSYRNKRLGIDKHHSMIPILSLIATGSAGLIYPYEPKSWICIIPALDLSNWSLLFLPFTLLKHWISEKNLKKA